MGNGAAFPGPRGKRWPHMPPTAPSDMREGRREESLYLPPQAFAGAGAGSQIRVIAIRCARSAHAFEDPRDD